MILYFIYTKATIVEGVKLETSLLAMRRKGQTANGETAEMLDELVMDEDYELLFKRLFNQAHADIVQSLSVNYLNGIPANIPDDILAAFPNYSEATDFALILNLHETFPLAYKKSIDTKLEQFLIDYVTWRWLETKSPQDAVTYQARLKPTLIDIQTLLIRKTTPVRLKPGFP